MQFNYNFVKTEEESTPDYRHYGLLPDNIIDDESSYLKKIEELENEIKFLKNNNKITEDLCDNLRNSMKTILQNAVILENELNDTKNKLSIKENEIKNLLRSSWRFR